MLEFYAGKANLSRCMVASGIRTASFDILFGDKAKKWDEIGPLTMEATAWMSMILRGLRSMSAFGSDVCCMEMIV